MVRDCVPVSLSGMLIAGAEMWDSSQTHRLGVCRRGTYVAQPPPSVSLLLCARSLFAPALLLRVCRGSR
eukprot:3802307-Pleurochrysis_carterae.AAC.1